MNPSTIPQIDLDRYMADGMTFEAYMELVRELVSAGRTTGPVQNEALSHYTLLNLTRMERILKTTTLSEELAQALKSAPEQHWLVITEAWCGDAAQNIPVIALMARENPKITLRLLLRDENLELMDRYLTSGKRSIPKLLAFDPASGKELFTWGARPRKLQVLVEGNMAAPDHERMAPEELKKQIQLWYTRDRTATMQREFTDLLG